MSTLDYIKYGFSITYDIIARKYRDLYTVPEIGDVPNLDRTIGNIFLVNRYTYQRIYISDEGLSENLRYFINQTWESIEITGEKLGIILEARINKFIREIIPKRYDPKEYVLFVEYTYFGTGYFICMNAKNIHRQRTFSPESISAAQPNSANFADSIYNIYGRLKTEKGKEGRCMVTDDITGVWLFQKTVDVTDVFQKYHGERKDFNARYGYPHLSDILLYQSDNMISDEYDKMIKYIEYDEMPVIIQYKNGSQMALNYSDTLLNKLTTTLRRLDRVLNYSVAPSPSPGPDPDPD